MGKMSEQKEKVVVVKLKIWPYDTILDKDLPIYQENSTN